MFGSQQNGSGHRHECGDARQRHPVRSRIGLALATVALAVVLSSPAQAAEIKFPFEVQVPLGGSPGAGAGQLSEPQGVAVDPQSHLVYVVETRNLRVSVFTAWGEFVRGFGWGVHTGADEPQVCTAETGCREGVPGSGPGQFGRKPAESQYGGPTGIAIDSAGNVYVMDPGNLRVLKFDPEGDFLLTFGGGVNGTTGGNVCTVASGDTCTEGKPGTEPGEFGIENVPRTKSAYLAVGPDDTVYAGDKNRIQRFDPDGSFRSSFPLPKEGHTGSLAVSPVTGNVYFGFSDTNNPQEFKESAVYGFDESGVPLAPLPTPAPPYALGFDPEGNLYVAFDPPLTAKGLHVRVSKYGPNGEEIGQLGEAAPGITVGGVAVGTVTNADDFAIYITRYHRVMPVSNELMILGPIPDPDVVGPPPQMPPAIDDQFAAAVNQTAATVRAWINPRFWTDTTYRVEFGTEPCDTGACTSKPLAPGVTLTSLVVNRPVLSGGVFLAGLEPATTYHYRFVAESEGGGPVAGPERTFTTAASPEPPRPCPANDAFRLGAGAGLPDCRAYELVTPLDKRNADVFALASTSGLSAALNQATPGGDRLTYSAYKAFADAQSSPYTSQYLTDRTDRGWQSRSISPPRSGPTLMQGGHLDVQFKLFTPDLCSGWFLQDTALSLAPEAPVGFPSLYRADLCSAGGLQYEAITRVAPPLQIPRDYGFEVQGRSDDSSPLHTVFRANDRLTDDAPVGAASKVYDYSDGSLKYVCLLPNGTALATGCSLGTGSGMVGKTDTRNGSVRNAISADGSRLYWSSAESGPGKLYLRSNGVETVAVSKSLAQFWSASANGDRAIFTEGSTLYGFKPEEDAQESADAIAGEVVGVVGMSDDARRIYYISKEALAPGADVGNFNLYLNDDGNNRFIAAVGSDDVSGYFRITSPAPWRLAARVNPSGTAVAFISSQGLTGRDTRDVNSGKPNAQVYLYHSASNALVCVSCNPTGARPIGRDIETASESVEFWASGMIPGWSNQLYASRALSVDGRRIFFESFDALVPQDTNGVGDVYQWAMDGTGSCEAAEGCVSLISSGESPQDSKFIDADAEGSNVFFATGSSLVQQDPGLIDIYDARIGGGFKPPTPPPAECEGESCQIPAPAPSGTTPASATFIGPPNAQAPGRARCPKAKRAIRRKGKTRCVRRQKARSRKTQNRSQQKTRGAAGHEKRREG